MSGEPDHSVAELMALRLAWAAGFLDGEGSLMLDPHHHPAKTPFSGLSPRISVGQKDRTPLEELHFIFGGNLGTKRNATQGCYAWEAAGAARVKAVLVAVLPYLVAKRAEAETVLAYAETMLHKPNNRPPTPEEILRRTTAVQGFIAARQARGAHVPDFTRFYEGSPA
jgi:hypothetical protein